MATMSADKSFKIKYKVLRKLEKGTLHKYVASLFVCPRAPYPLGEKNKENIFLSYESSLGAKRVKPEKYDVQSKTLKKWLLILRSENVPFNKPLFKEKASRY